MTTKQPNPRDAAKLKALREATGLSQPVFAALVGKDEHQMSKYESGARPIPAPLLILATITADKIARAEYFKRLNHLMKAAKEKT
jgi:DNA-binding transcriptional regulator YiaG